MSHYFYSDLIEDPEYSRISDIQKWTTIWIKAHAHLLREGVWVTLDYTWRNDCGASMGEIHDELADDPHLELRKVNLKYQVRFMDGE